MVIKDINDLPKVKLVGCWAHARRKFDEALTAMPAELKNKEKPVLRKKDSNSAINYFPLSEK